jgi:hypothetical protein
MSYEGVKQVLFETAASGSDWRFPYKLAVPGLTAWDPVNDEIVLGMNPDGASWDDYGMRSREFPPSTQTITPPFMQFSSRDGDGVVVLVDPNLIDILVPWNRMRQLGPGGVAIEIQYRNPTGSRQTLLTGRMSLIAGVF